MYDDGQARSTLILLQQSLSAQLEMEDTNQSVLELISESSCSEEHVLRKINSMVEQYDHSMWFEIVSNHSVLLNSCGLGWMKVASQLIGEFGLDPKLKDRNNCTALHHACKSGSVDLVLYLIDKCKCDPHQSDSDGLTPLHYAIAHEKLELIKYFIGSDNSLKPDYAISIIKSALRNWNSSIMKYLVSVDSIAVALSPHQILMKCSKFHGVSDELDFLVNECNCDPNCQDNHGNTLLHYFCQAKHLKFRAFLEVFKKYKLHPHVMNAQGETPLHIICLSLVKQGITDDKCMVLSFLIGNGANVSPHITFSSNDVSVLSVACKVILHGNHSPLILRYLIIDCRCDPSYDSDIILYTLCNAVNAWSDVAIELLSHLILKNDISPFFTVHQKKGRSSINKKVCILCCPIKDRFLYSQKCEVCHCQVEHGFSPHDLSTVEHDPSIYKLSLDVNQLYDILEIIFKRPLHYCDAVQADLLYNFSKRLVIH